MMSLDYWKAWGSALSEESFADAFVALGVLASTAAADAGVMAPAADNSGGKCLASDLEAALFPLLAAAMQDERNVAWRFPLQNATISLGDRSRALSHLDPQLLATAWKAAAGRLPVNVPEGSLPRFRVSDYRSPGPDLSWFGLFFRGRTAQAASLVLDAPETALQLRWPLRIGYLPGNVSDECLGTAGALRPLNTLTRAVRIDRSTANCDVLIFNGCSGLLGKALAELPMPLKCNMTILRGALDDSADIVRISEKTRMSGMVILPGHIADFLMADALNAFIENLSHNQLFDAALSSAFGLRCPTDPVIALSNRLAAFRLEQMVEAMHARLRAMPPAARVALPSPTLQRLGMAGGAPDDVVSDVATLERRVALGRKTIPFIAESTGASGLADVNLALERAEEPKEALEKRAQRFLQQRTWLVRNGGPEEEKTALRHHIPAVVRVRIGPPDDSWDSLQHAFPMTELPQDLDHWRLTVVLSEPNHIPEPLRGQIILLKDGPSTECEFSFVPREHELFEGRVIVLHRGRVLQTGVLRAPVIAEGKAVPDDARITFGELVPVRANIGDLEGRRQYDAAFVLNHTSDYRPRLTAIAADHAWLSDLTACQDIVKDINGELTKVAESEKDYRGGLENEENVKILVRLAKIGRDLYGKIVEDQISDADNRASFAGLEYLQIVSTKSDAWMPLEFIYTAVAPDPDAALCPTIADAVQDAETRTRHEKVDALLNGSCSKADREETECPYRSTSYVCPAAFWGVSKVIERHMSVPRLAQPGIDFFLQSEPTSQRGELDLSGTALIAASQKVKPGALAPVKATCAKLLGAVPQEAKDWNQWVQFVQTYKPRVLLALPHTDGNGSNATMEISGKTLGSGQITRDHVHPKGEETFPLVALLGCDTTGTALEYGDHVSWFRRGGAALVVSTIAKVFGDHAAAVAQQLVNGLQQDPRQERVGEVIRQIKRRALVEGSLMALCVVAFGDADWKLSELHAVRNTDETPHPGQV